MTVSGPARIAVDLLGPGWDDAQVSEDGMVYVTVPIDPAGSTLLIGQILVAVDLEHDVVTEAAVMNVNQEAGHVLLAVDRRGIREDPDVPGDPGCE